MSITAILFKSTSSACIIVHNFSQWWFVAKFGCGCTWSSIGIVQLPFVPMQCDTLPSSIDHLTRVRVLIARLIIEKSGKTWVFRNYTPLWDMIGERHDEISASRVPNRESRSTFLVYRKLILFQKLYACPACLEQVLPNRTKDNTSTCKKR